MTASRLLATPSPQQLEGSGALAPHLPSLGIALELVRDASDSQVQYVMAPFSYGAIARNSPIVLVFKAP